MAVLTRRPRPTRRCRKPQPTESQHGVAASCREPAADCAQPPYAPHTAATLAPPAQPLLPRCVVILVACLAAPSPHGCQPLSAEPLRRATILDRNGGRARF
uniref:Uncharacterized protein n=1 Tax=Oryza barthii TaxID=65489 RepID=A0A0D3H6P1_9ORYZ